ncbi:MAG: porin [Burkholderiales bacterium]
MQKKVMALAVAGALAAPAALAQVQIGGSIHLQYYNHDGDNASASKTTDFLTTSEPEIYIRGEEKLGGGLSAWFQCTSSFDVIGTTAQSASAGWCGRNSAIGFRGGFGNVFFGTWDTPQKLVFSLGRGWWGATNTLQGGTGVILLNGSQSNAGNTGTSFHRRQARLVSYHSPDWSGFVLQAAFSAANESVTLADSSPLDPRLMSVAGQFRTGPFFAGLGYESHKDFSTTGSSDSNITFTAGYTFAGAVRVSGTYVINEYDPDPGSAKREQDGFAIYVDWTLGGPHKLYLQYGSRGETDVAGVTAANTDAEVLGVAYGYSFSKRTQGYIAYNELSNGSASTLSFGTGAVTAGGTQKVFGVGLRHSF